jgi:hypothetical protein
MTPSDLMIRFEELSAGRAMGDLTREEERELMILSEELATSPDLAFDLLATTCEMMLLENSVEPLPAALAARLHQCAEDIANQQPENIVRPHVPVWQKIIRSPLLGWAAAAAVLIYAVLGSQKSAIPPPAVAESRLRSEAADLIERNFQGIGTYKDTRGKVVWSDSKQQGFMTLSGIPVNDPKRAQYQLWIVDPKRDEVPVDGGVFDIPSDGTPVVIPIVAKLSLTNPLAFVITLEQPGGVVKSKQEQVVALAKN